MRGLLVILLLVRCASTQINAVQQYLQSKTLDEALSALAAMS